MLTTFRQIMQTDGVRALFRGNLISILKIVPESAVFWGGYEFLRYQLALRRAIPPKDLNQLENFFAGSLAGGLGMIAVPLCYALSYAVGCPLP